MKTSLAALIMFICFLFCGNNTNAQLTQEKKLSLKDAPEFHKLLIVDKTINYNRPDYSSRDLLLTDDQKYHGSSFSRESMDLNYQQQKKKKKSVGLGILLSALLPGSGEFYGEDYLKAGIFFGIELLAWGTYFYFDNKGDTQTEDFQNYADTYWDVRTYASWLVDEGFPESGGINPDEPNRDILREQIMVCERANFSHTMPEYESQQFYELIGKYQNFQAGWTNLSNRPTRGQGPYWYETYHDPVFTNYAVERQKANDFYDYAKIGPITAMVNHILSAADAAWVISTYNKKIKLQTGFRIQNRVSPYTLDVKQIPTFNMSVLF
jgi:hypothetical protein